MKKKLVLWGAGENEEKLLLAIELIDTENKVKIHSFPESIATETFYKELMDKWRSGVEITFPEGAKTVERPLSITESILPDDIKVERTDLINRAKTEWHFVVLSSKLYEMYQSELSDLSDRVKSLKQFESATWEELKGFWSKVQAQTREKNLFRDHADKLREETNGLFDSLKQLRRKLDKEYQSKSEETKKVFMEKLGNIQEKIDKGLGLSPLFNELKNIQNEFRESKFTKDDREKVWKKLDGAFKQVKEKRFGDKASDKGTSGLDRVNRRYNGLMSAIDKMQKSIGRDRKDIDYQGKIIEETNGQLEQQIRQAKIKMVEERIASKNVKLDDMMKTKDQLEKKIESLKVREEKAKEQQKVNVAKEQVKERIAKEIAEKNKALEGDEKVQAAVKSLLDAKPPAEKAEVEKEVEAKEKTSDDTEKKESLIGAIGTTLSESLEDVVDTVKAVADVVGDKVEDKISQIKEDAKDEDGKGSVLGTVVSTVSETMDDVSDKVKEVGDVISDKVGDTYNELSEKIEDKEEADDSKEENDETDQEEKKGSVLGTLASTISETMDDVADKVKEVGDVITDKVEDTISEIQDKKEEQVEDTKEKDEEKKEGFLGALTSKLEDVADTVKAVADVVTDKVEDAVSEIKEEFTGEEE